MDDPWGSPWAEELHQPAPAPNSKGANGLTLAPIAQGNNNAVTTEKTNSPWDVPGEGFGSWAEAPEEQEIKENSEVSGGSLEWGSQGAEHSTKLDISGISPHWDESQAGSGLSTPKLSPVPLPTPTKLPRPASPDPWANSAASTDGDLKDVPEVGGQVRKLSLEDVTISSSPGDRQTEQHEESPFKTEDKPLQEFQGSATTIEAPPEGDPEEAEMASVPDKDSAENNVEAVSRSSSSPSDHSHHDETHSESPRTSLDEDSHRPEAQRHVSGKIQVLVEHFDALAKAQLDESVIVGRGPSSSRGDDDEEEPHDEQAASREASPEERQTDKAESDAEETEEEEVEVEEADDDFGDFEEGHSQISDSIGEEEETSVAIKKETPDDKTLQDQEEKPSPTTNATPNRPPPKDFGRVKYIVDIPLLETLYPGLNPEPTSIDSADKLYIPDTIPRDSFVSVEERKMWYRLSRYTTLRQHNSGDDDNNYIRVSWMGSKIREETLKLAGKWMEQDRISGRVVLGGDSKDGSLFGWNDSKAAPMPLAAAFAMSRGKKKSNAPTKATASSASPEVLKELPRVDVYSQPPQKQRRRSSTKAPRISEETEQRKQQPVASFGWSSEPQTAIPVPAPAPDPRPIPSNQTSSFQKPETSHLPPTLDTMPSSGTASTQQIPNSLDGWNTSPPIIKASTPLQTTSNTVAPAAPVQNMPSSFDGWDAPPLSVKTSAPAMPVTTIKQNPANDFNDDWGDMVSSPVVASAPQMPPVRGLRHKKSQSLIGTAFPTAQAFSNGPEAPSIPLGNSHRPTSSLDGFSMSNMKIPVTTPGAANQLSTNAAISNTFTTPTNNATSAANSSYDPWAAADFSVFETPAPPPKPKSAPPSKPTHRPRVNSVTFESTRAAPAQLSTGHKALLMQQQRTIMKIVHDLPDLSYMMRR